MKNKNIPQNKIVIIEEIVQNKIYLVRGQKVMLDSDLANLYQVETKVLNQSVRRNVNRFPEDFMFQLDNEEENNLRSQIVTSSYGGKRKPTFAFTEQGVAMLSSVLRSDRAIQVNIQIMRIFTNLRQMILTQKDLQEKIENLESKYDEHFRVVFDALRQLIQKDSEPKRQIGFETNQG
jgi:DNA-binding PadR family transcriptional regulator